MLDHLAPTELPQGPRSVLVDGRAHIVPDLTHHLSEVSKKRLPSPLKQLAKYMAKPGLIVLAGGMPHPDYFPYDSVSAKVLPFDAYGTAEETSTGGTSLNWLWRMLGFGGSSEAPRTEDIMIPKYDARGREANQLSTSLQYGTAMGIVPLNKFVNEFARKVFKPYLPMTTTLLTCGNTDGWNRIVQTLMNPGEAMLVEEWTYPSALSSARPFDISFIPVAMDGEGMRADSLEYLLSHWNEEERGGAKRPHVMYTVPIGQNPSGATMGAQRKKDIYDVCVKYDIIICEDDPYYFLQEGPYVPQSYRSGAFAPTDPEEWIDSLSPSFVKFDYEGRVIRMDTFSKTIAPGTRMGFFTCSPLFADRLQRVGETSVQNPSGFAQSLVSELLANHWGLDKYIRWLQGLQSNYTNRRDQLIDSIAQEFHISEETSEVSYFGGTKVFAAQEKTPAWAAYEYTNEKKGRDTWFSFIPPTSGMFVWVRVHLANHPNFGVRSTDDKTPDEHLEARLFYMLADHGLLIGPGWFFSTRLEDAPIVDPSDPTVKDLARGGGPMDAPGGNPDDHDPSQYAHFRIAFSSASVDDFKKAMQIMAKVMKQFFEGDY